jgi:hypothetical protein
MIRCSKRRKFGEVLGGMRRASKSGKKRGPAYRAEPSGMWGRSGSIQYRWNCRDVQRLGACLPNQIVPRRLRLHLHAKPRRATRRKALPGASFMLCLSRYDGSLLFGIKQVVFKIRWYLHKSESIPLIFKSLCKLARHKVCGMWHVLKL